MGAGIKRFIFYLLLASFLDACTHVGKKQILPNHHHYFKAGQHYTFAVYDTHNQLISHPFERWLEASKRALDDGKPYTDLYIISHGWNFTYQEAVSNFNRYMDIWDNKTNEGFRPYIIFILWNSTSRPITESITAIFPFGIDDSLSPVSDVSDTAIHLVTGWKQSLNAQHNALGKNFPIVYKYKNYSFEEINGETGLEGRDIPLSMILYEIIKANNKTLPIYIKAEIEEIPDFKSKKTYEPQRIHLIGHSYGAKLISLASLEALHRFFPDNTIDPSSPISRTSMLALRDLHPDKIKLPKSYSLALLESLNLNPGGNYKADHFIKRHTNTLQTQSLNPQSNTNESSRQKNNDFVESPNPPTTFESLVLMNAAFGPEELEYDYDLGHSIKPEKQFSLWNHIPRKALVYSNTDLATGLLFNTGQIVFNNRWGQFYSSVDKSTRSFLNNIYSPLVSKGKNRIILLRYFFTFWHKTYEFIYGATNLVSTIAYSPATWAFGTVFNLPEDLYHHVVNNDTFGESPYWKFLNVPHFFLPIDKLWPYWGLGDDNFSDQQGFWQSTSPAIGRTGLHRLRTSDAGVFKIFIDKDEKEQESSDISAKHFNSLACSLEYHNPDHKYYKNEKLFYSFNGSEVYDSWFSHGDLRETEPATVCGNDNDRDIDIIQKREATFNFITKFTLGERYPYTDNRSSNQQTSQR